MPQHSKLLLHVSEVKVFLARALWCRSCVVRIAEKLREQRVIHSPCLRDAGTIVITVRGEVVGDDHRVNERIGWTNVIGGDVITGYPRLIGKATEVERGRCSWVTPKDQKTEERHEGGTVSPRRDV